MRKLRIRWRGDAYEVESFYGTKGRERHVYHNIIDFNHEKLAQVLIDLYLEGYPIEKAIKLFLEKQHKPRDWMGV